MEREHRRSFQDFFIDIISSGKYSKEDEDGMSDYIIRYIVLNFVSITGSVVLLAYIALRAHTWKLGTLIVCVTMLIVTIMTFVLSRAKNIPQFVPAMVLMFAYGLLCIATTYLGAALGSNFLFAYVYPPLTIMLLGMRRGIILSTILLIVLSFEMIIPGWSLYSYPIIVPIHMIITYVLTLSVMAVIEITRKTKDRMIENQNWILQEQDERSSEIMIEAKKLIEHVATTTEYLSKFTKDINSSIDEQFPIFDKTMTSSTNVIASFGMISAHTAEQMDFNQKGKLMVNHLKDEFGNTIASSESIQSGAGEIGKLADKCQSKLDNASSTITTLKDESSRIAEISKTINEIADMTALLSLNASIESARAGEHGRGFAVVADEISKLAEGSMNSAKEISNITKLSVNRIMEAADQVFETAAILKEIIGILNNNRSFIISFQDVMNNFGQQLQGLLDYFDVSVKYAQMIGDLTEKNSEEISTYQTMITNIGNFYSNLNNMSEKLTEVSLEVNNEIFKLEDILKGWEDLEEYEDTEEYEEDEEGGEYS